MEAILSKDQREDFEKLWRADPNKADYHPSCKLNTFNKSKTSSKKRNKEKLQEMEESRLKKQRSNKALLPYKDKCILCTKDVSLYKNNKEKAKKTYSRPDSMTAEDLKKRLLDTADKRLQAAPGGVLV